MADVHDLFNSEETVELTSPENPFSNGNSTEDIFAEDFSVNADHIKKLEQNLSLPAGMYKWYRSDAGLTVAIRKRYIEEDKEIGDLSSNGRLIYNVSGMVDPTQRRFSFDISPDIRYRRDEQGNIKEPKTNDFANDNWAKFSKLHFSKYERHWEKTSEILKVILQGSYFFYISLSKNGGNFLGNLRGM